jgi:hypothetical protein
VYFVWVSKLKPTSRPQFSNGDEAVKFKNFDVGARNLGGIFVHPAGAALNGEPGDAYPELA